MAANVNNGELSYFTG